MGAEWLEAYWLYTLVITWAIGSFCSLLPPSITREYLPQRATLGKDQNSQFELWFLLNTYCCLSMKSKVPKSNHHMLGAFCIGKHLYTHSKDISNSVDIMFMSISYQTIVYLPDCMAREAFSRGTFRISLPMWAEKSSRDHMRSQGRPFLPPGNQSLCLLKHI